MSFSLNANALGIILALLWRSILAGIAILVRRRIRGEGEFTVWTQWGNVQPLTDLLEHPMSALNLRYGEEVRVFTPVTTCLSVCLCPNAARSVRGARRWAQPPTRARGAASQWRTSD